MSAFIVSKKHIDIMVDALSEDHTPELHKNTTGQMFWEENYKSVNARYNEQDKCPEYVFEKPEKEYTPVEVAKLVHCYMYQSCEHDEWDGSDAQSISVGLLNDLWRRMPGYDSAEWSI